MPRKAPRRPFPKSPNSAKNNKTYRKRLAARSSNSIPVTDKKTCPRCSEEKPASAFGKSTTSRDGLKTACKECRKAEYEKKRDRMAGMVPSVPEENACAKCGDVKPRSMFSRATVSSDGLERRCKACAKAHHALWYLTEAPRMIAKARDWEKKNPEKTAAKRKRQDRDRQAKRAVASGKLDDKEWFAILRYFNHTCAYCLRDEVIAGKMTVEHMLPLSRGGVHEPENVVPACKRCNSSKHALTPIEFMARRALMGI